MDFTLTEERVMLRDMLRRFLSEQYDHDTRQAVLAAGAPFDAGIWAQLAELGILGALFPEANGGFGGAGFDIALVFEELGRAGVIEPVLSSAILGGGLVAMLGTADQQALLAEVKAGTTLLAFAHSEPGTRYDPADVSISVGEGRTLSGIKTHVLGAAEAHMLVVSAREGGAAGDTEGLSLFLVPADAPGIHIAQHVTVDGVSAGTVRLENVILPETARLGPAGRAFDAIEAVYARGTLAVSAEALGAMETAKEMTISYLKERQQFGRPIGRFQALQHRMADVAMEVEQARSAVINLAGHLEAARGIRERHVSAAKNLIGRIGALVAEEAVQLHGGIGMTNDYALSHFVRRIVMIDHLFGDVDYHLERFVQLDAALS
ncbi:acyl-CoA dehydrogenase family protein [Epibacterium sp. MM17-32]|uniref:acyl-CoA dehydrogenase family protein n=1 Tax=Epibacterium sp. MM17-32 TaxID=2917734 RepID=UPI001EF65EEF|nr:acyl-CoA dehydrogenase family protein [Epibacterium sp. MM17-32]MCG7629960.1 acyl-CoA dehydrogenase family protein [Epibacterium sp. MM17-32]